MSEYPRVTYQCPGRTFDRLLKEQSLDETKDVVRKKLGLGHDAPLELVQLRDGRRIDLEDDDDFEAFKALTKSSLHATVAVAIQTSSRSPSSSAGTAPGEGKRQPNSHLLEPRVPDAVQTGEVSSSKKRPLVHLPSPDATGTSLPPKRRKVVLDGDTLMLDAPQPCEPPVSKMKDVRLSSYNVLPTAVDESTPGAATLAPSKSKASLPATPAKNVEPSTQTQIKEPRMPKQKATKVAHTRADHAEDLAGTSHKKMKKVDGAAPRKEPPSEHGVLDPGNTNMSSDLGKKRSRKGQGVVSEITTEDRAMPTRTPARASEHSRAQPTSPTTGDASLQPGMEVTNSDILKQAKPGKQKSRPADAAGSSTTKPKAGSADPAEDDMPDPAKSLKKRASKKKVEPEISNGIDDDINKTIVAFLTKRLEADPSAFSGVVAAPSGLDLPLLPKRNKKGNMVKPSAGTGITQAIAQVPPTSSVGKGSEGSDLPKVNQRTSKLGRPGPVAPRNAEGSNAPIVGPVVVEEARESRQNPTSKRYSTLVEHTGPEPSPKPGPPRQDRCPVCSENPVHLLSNCPVVQEGPDSIEARITQMEKNPGLVPSSEVITALRQLAKKAAKARSTPPDSSSDSSDTESSQTSILLPTPTPFPKGVSNTGAQPTISTGLEISEVPVEAHGEGSSSSESSTEDESEGDGLTTVTASVNVPSAPVHLLEDQITALIRGPVKRGPRRSILDEIPSSSSESEGETSPEDLVLDEEEDLSRQPLHKQLRALSTTRPSSIEPEHTSEDEADVLMPIYMDTSHEVPDRSQKFPAIGQTGDHVSFNAEVEEPERPEVDTYPAQPLEARNQDHPISLQTTLSKVDATALQSRPGTKIPGPASPESDATAINNTDPAKSPILASAEQQTGRVLVPPSSPIKDGGATDTKEKALSQDADDDVESTVETPHGDQETDPIEPESTQSRPPSNQGIDPASCDLHRRAPRTALNTPPAPEQPSRRSGRLANRRFSMSTAEDLVPLAQVRHKVTLALKSTIPSAKDNKGVRDDAEDATREKRVLKQVGKSGNKSARSTTRNRDDSGCETSPSVAREDGSPRAPVTSKLKRTTSPPSEKAQQSTSSVVDEIHTSSQGPPVMPPPGEVGPSATDAEAQTPVPSRRSAMTPSQKKKGGLQPLFFPGSSQVPRALSPSRSESENESETAVSLPRKTPTRSTPGSVSRFRLLSELANRNMFSKSKAAQQRLKNTPMQPPRFDAGDDREDDDEDSSSSSDDATLNSHIPKERRAGAARKKRQGLSSLGNLK